MASDMLRGFRAALPIAASVMAYGSVLGVLAAQKGLSWTDMMFMNTAVFAGSAQFVMVDMWSAHLPLLEMTLAVFVINLRYLLIGASLQPLFANSGLLRKAAMIHFVADENWALTMAEQRKGRGSIPFLFGAGMCVYSAWSGGTLAGLLGGASIARPEDFALDFAFTAVFTALAVSLWQGKKDILPWIVAGVLALVSEQLLPGKWYIVIGGFGGALAAMLGPDEEKTSRGETADAGGRASSDNPVAGGAEHD